MDPSWRNANRAAASFLNSVCRASLTNGEIAVAGSQSTTYGAIHGPCGPDWDASWHPTARRWPAPAGLSHQSSQANELLGPPTRTATIISVVVRSIALAGKRGKRSATPEYVEMLRKCEVVGAERSRVARISRA